MEVNGKQWKQAEVSRRFLETSKKMTEDYGSLWKEPEVLY
jgi:hypothetical protein